MIEPCPLCKQRSEFNDLELVTLRLEVLALRQLIREISPPEPYVGLTSAQTFHRPMCPALKARIDEGTIDFVSRADAIAGGYKPCVTCRA